MLAKYWGAPDEITHQDDGREVWEYKQGLRWNGAVVAFIIPVPLILPVGNNHIEFTFDSDRHIATVKLVGVGGGGVFCAQLHTYECSSSFEWVCKFLPWCRYEPTQPIVSTFRERRPERLIPGQLEPLPAG